MNGEKKRKTHNIYKVKLIGGVKIMRLRGLYSIHMCVLMRHLQVWTIRPRNRSLMLIIRERRTLY